MAKSKPNTNTAKECRKAMERMTMVVSQYTSEKRIIQRAMMKNLIIIKSNMMSLTMNVMSIATMMMAVSKMNIRLCSE